MRRFVAATVITLCSVGFSATATAGCPSYDYFDPVEVVQANRTSLEFKLRGSYCGGAPTEQHFLVWVHDDRGQPYGGLVAPVSEAYGDDPYPVLYWFPDEPLPTDRSYRVEILPFASPNYHEGEWPTRPSRVFKVLPRNIFIPEEVSMIESIESDLQIETIQVEACCQTDPVEPDRHCWTDETRFEPVLQYELAITEGWLGHVMIRPADGHGAGKWFVADSFEERNYLRRLRYPAEHALPACTSVDVVHRYYGTRRTVEICSPQKKFVSEPITHPRPDVCFTPPEFARQLKADVVQTTLAHGHVATFSTDAEPNVVGNDTDHACSTGSGGQPLVWTLILAGILWVRRRSPRAGLER